MCLIPPPPTPWGKKHGPKILCSSQDLLVVVISSFCSNQLTIGWKNRIRSQVGQTNRWRLSTWMGTDLLGTSQAVRAMLEAPSDGIITKNDLSEAVWKTSDCYKSFYFFKLTINYHKKLHHY